MFSNSISQRSPTGNGTFLLTGQSAYENVLPPHAWSTEHPRRRVLRGNFIGTDYGIAEDLSQQLPDEWRDFNAKFIPVYLAAHTPTSPKSPPVSPAGPSGPSPRGLSKGTSSFVPTATPATTSEK